MYTDRGLGIGDLSIGVSAGGTEEYLANLKTELLTNVSSKIVEDYKAVKDALDRGWQGQSRDKFDMKFEQVKTQLIADLEAEYNDLERRINEITENYLNQDKNMIID